MVGLDSSGVKACHQCGAPGVDGARFCFRCGASLPGDEPEERDPLVGRTLGSGYLLQELVGLGGMGRVYRAEQVALGRTVAVKVVHPHLLSDPRSVQRFYQEARAASTINHPNSVGVIDFGHTDDGILYLVMEFVEGKDLADLLSEQGALPPERAASILMSVLDALAEAHALGVIHRDLKPENIILRRHRSGRDFVKVVDFGLAMVVRNEDASGITQPGAVCGTPDYMAPEQARGQEVDARADLYAVGVLLFEMLTGKLPYEDGSPTAVVLRHLHDPVPDPLQVAPERGIPPALAAVARKAMAKAPPERFQSAEQMREALCEAMASIARGKVSGAFVPCVGCGAHNPESLHYCGTCGARLLSVPPPVREVSGPSVPPPAEGFVGFQEEMALLEASWREGVASGEGRFVLLRGDPGWGRSRLLEEFARSVQAEGGVVFWGEPHPSEAPVAGSTLRGLLGSMLRDAEGPELEDFADPRGGLSEAARVGVDALIEPKGVSGAVPTARVAAVAAALAEAASRVAERVASKGLLFVFDDVEQYDVLSRGALLRWLGHGRRPAGLVVVVHSSRSAALWRPDREILVRGWSQQEAESFVRGAGGQVGSGSVSVSPEARLAPLYVRQVLALGLPLREVQRSEPRLADVVSRRLDRLEARSRHLLQACCVLGRSASLASLWTVADGRDEEALHDLERHGLLVRRGERVAVVHPFLARLVETSIPAAVRREMHRRALRAATEASEPIEVRAEHAFRSGGGMAALLLLDGMGAAATRRGLFEDAVLAYRRALDLVRQAMYAQRPEGDEGTFVRFVSKLGEAMMCTGDLSGAEGLLREALEYVGPSDVQRGRIALLLGQVSRLRERHQEASRWLQEAVAIGARYVDGHVVARAKLELARLRRAEGDTLGAANAHRLAVEALDAAEAPVGWRLTGRLERAQVLIDLGDAEEAERVLREALELADRFEEGALAARCRGELGALLELRGARAEAAESYALAARQAVASGDVEGYRRWRRAADALEQAA